MSRNRRTAEERIAAAERQLQEAREAKEREENPLYKRFILVRRHLRAIAEARPKHAAEVDRMIERTRKMVLFYREEGAGGSANEG